MKQDTSLKGGMKRKVVLTILIVSSSILFSGIALTYFMGLDLLSNALGKQYEQAARRLGSFVMDNIKGEVEDSIVYTQLPLWVDFVKDANLKYKDMAPKDVASYLESMDKRWLTSKNTDPFMWGYLSNRISVSIQTIVKARGGIVELFLTDKYGGLVAASNKTSDFCQSDEEWWRKAYSEGKGGLYISSIEFDESSDEWVISIAAPMRDEGGVIIGVCKDSLGLKRLFSNIALFTAGKTGRAFLVNEEGRIVFPYGLPYTGKQLFSREKLDALLSDKKRFMFISEKLLSDKRSFMAFSSINPPITQKPGVVWTIFVVQDALEVSKPLDRFVTQLGMITICLLALMIPLGMFFGERIVKPIRKLRDATQRFISGDWEHGIDIRTGDEIEQFAGVFNDMLTQIKNKQARLEEFSSDLEEKVEERTKKLSETQEATLNILEDLEEAKEGLERSNKELKKLDQLKSDFVSTVSHELRTPLSIIKEGISLVIDKVPGDVNEKQEKILEIAKFNIDRLARIIDSLLDISKIEAGKVELKKSLVDIAGIVKQVAASFEIKLREKGLELKLDIDSEAGKVYADSDRITQVLTNLMGNAVKFTPSGYVKISCKGIASSVTCSVSDTGVGISKADLPKIFDKFQQFGRIAGPGDRGTGLGLSIAKGIIDMHDGSISVESELKKGSCFTFSLRRYTERTLFSDHVDEVINSAARSRTKVSIITVFSNVKDGPDGHERLASFHAAMSDSAREIKNTLRKQDDKVISNDGDMLVILVNCGAEHCALVKRRLEQIIARSFEEKKIKGYPDAQYGCATFPDDGRTGIELINKAHSAGR